ncbi:MAG TPA: hypothetical protein VGJ18_13645 [Gemmatimonadaceae bacterium]|jgi:hypothetical protein
MRTIRRVATAAALAITYAAPLVVARAQSLPSRLSDDEFWRLVNDLSEAGGYFRSDNFVSNETTFQHVIPELAKSHPPGGVYLGVGPDQNFTYIVALKPRMAIITDIRRQNMIEHLMYKAAMEMSPTRADFLSLLFSRARPAGLSDTTGAPALMQAYVAAPSDSMLYRKNIAAIKDHLVMKHHFALSADDLSSLTYVYEAFFDAGPDLTYSFSVGRQGRASFFGRRMPSYGELMAESDALGIHRSYLASEENYRTLRELELNNLLVPIVGDFAGEKALRAVGSYLKQHNATVTAFYTSNVEQYLFQQADDWRKFFANVATLPLDGKSTFIRAVFNYMGFRDPSTGAPGPRSTTMLSPIVDVLKAVDDGKIQTYYDVIQLSTAPVPAPE